MKSNIEWKYWGQKDPLYGVAAWEGREKGGARPWTDDEFYHLGEQDWADFIAHWVKYGLYAGHCLEIGCGAGRLTRPMARTFAQVVAVDVSEAMIAYAKNNIQSPNVEYHVVEGSVIPGPEASLDAVFSTHVFQHFENQSDAALYFCEIDRVLKPGGSLMIHLPVCMWPAGGRKMLKFMYRLKKQIGNLTAALKRFAIRRGRNAKLMRMLSYEAEWLYAQLAQLGFEDVEFSTFLTRSNGDPHTFLFARKPG